MFIPSFWKVKSSWEVWGTLVPNQKVLPRIALLLTWKCVPYVACLVIHLLKFWSSISWKTITKGSKSGFSTKSSQIEHFTWRVLQRTKKWKTWFGIHVFSFFLASEILLRSMGNPSAKPKGFTTNSTFVNMEVRSICCMFGDSSVEILVIYILKNNHQRVQVWIQHQKFTNRAFYMKSFIKKKQMKNLVWDSCLFLLFGKWNPPEKYGEP